MSNPLNHMPEWLQGLITVFAGFGGGGIVLWKAYRAWSQERHAAEVKEVANEVYDQIIANLKEEIKRGLVRAENSEKARTQAEQQVRELREELITLRNEFFDLQRELTAATAKIKALEENERNLK